MNRQILLLVVATFILSGCQSIDRTLYQGYSARPLGTYQAIVTSVTAQNEGIPAIAPIGCFGTVGSISAATAASAANVANHVSVDDCKVARNQVIGVLSIASEQICREHRQGIYGREATANIALGSLTNLFSGAAAVVSPASQKSLYAALALFSNSERSLLNETVYKQMIVAAVDQKIVDQMKAKADVLKGKLKQSINDFSMQEAIGEMIEIHNSCSFMDGLRLALAEGTKDTSSVKIQTSRQSLNIIDLDVRTFCSVANKGITDLQCTAAQQRYTAASDKLKELESASN